mgnify:CR=1 FL=1
MKIRIKPKENSMYFSTLDSVENFMTRAIARLGYSVTKKENQVGYKAEITEKIDQEIIKNLIITECEQIGLEYEIID